MAKNNNHNNNHIEDFENLIDHAIKEENFKEINEFISQSLNSAVNITKSSINKLFNKTNDNRPYRVCEDDNIINQKPKAEKKSSCLVKFSKTIFNLSWYWSNCNLNRWSI